MFVRIIIIHSFIHRIFFTLVIFYWSLSDNMSTQFISTLLKIQLDHNNPAIGILYILVISHTFFFRSRWGPFQVRPLQLVSPLPSFFTTFFSSQGGGKGVFTFCIFSFSRFCPLCNSKIHSIASSFFLENWHYVIILLVTFSYQCYRWSLMESKWHQVTSCL